MALGDKIQFYRKRMNLSQEDLAGQLYVSRQTISLWEKGQTIPTVENLLILAKIFGVSTDEILDIEIKEVKNKIPCESFTVSFSKQEISKILREQIKMSYKRPIVFGITCICLIILFFALSAPDFLIGVFSGFFALGIISYSKGLIAVFKSYKINCDRIAMNTYEYQVFENCLFICIYRNGEKVRESKYTFSDIEMIYQGGATFFMQINGQTFIIPKKEIGESSFIYSYMYQNPLKTKVCTMPNKWRTLSNILFAATLFSIWGALILVATVTKSNQQFISNMWLFFLMTPVPVSSIVMGFVLKCKGYKYKKNMIAGFIILALLCIYGSFTFMF